MKFELLILAITGFFVMNTYYDGKYMEIAKSWTKYFKMAGFIFTGFSIYIFLKKNPNESKSIVSHISDIIKYMPVNRDASDMLSPFMDFTNQKSFFNSPNQYQQQESRIINSGKTGTKRCVSETKKKFVAAQQSWTCNGCNRQLPAWFEVDHKIRLENGGSNHVDNLEALCRDCHGKKTAMENL
jgi:hypothetical protein